MKSIIIILSLIQGYSYAITLAEGLRKDTEKAITNPSHENVMKLAEEIRDNNIYAQYLTPEALEENKIAREKIVTIPGHAQYFIDFLEKERAEMIEPDGFRGTFDNDRYHYIKETLRHLPSPETIHVLGELLYDSRDLVKVLPPHSDASPTPENELLASDALAHIGLNDPPVPPGTENDENRKTLAAFRIWYDEVKAGKRSFSFIGHNVSYRFKPDGSVESSPRDGSRDQDPPFIIPAAAMENTPPASSNPWPRAAITVGIAALIGLVFRQIRRMKGRS